MAGAVALSRLTGAVLGGCALVLLAQSFGSCSSPAESASPKADAGPDADAASETAPPDAELDSPTDHPTPPWDPVWHEAKPAAFKVVPPGPRRAKSCGAGCEVIAETDPEGTGQRRPRANDDWAVFQVVPGGRVHAVHLKTEMEYVVDDGKGWPEGIAAGGGPSVSKDLIFYTVRAWWGSMRIVRSLGTGEAKIVSSSEGSAGTITTSFAHPFAYWDFGPPDQIFRFDLRDGSISSIPGGGCIILEGASNGLATCAGEGFVDLIDFDKGTTSKLGSSKYQDIAGSISPDGKTAAWIDTRDPDSKGAITTYLDPGGGEVYVKELLSGKETRITSDSPQGPVIKSFPRLVDGRLVWQSWAGIPTQLPADLFIWELPAPVWFAIDGEKPAALTDPMRPVAFPQPVSSGVVGTLSLANDAGFLDTYLVHIAWPASTDGG
ncbi:MAG: hypothetical protein U0263_08820 [Polyangiaceae bacterium]